ncbi:MAG TPA: hypothetical protein VGI17_17725 [Solirubrobacterales bacterium]
MKRTTYAFALSAVIAAVVIAGCGGGGSSSSSSESGGSGGGGESEGAPAKATNSSSTGTIGTTSIEGLGTVLVDSSGMTVYEYTPDKGPMSTCYGECEAFWPPVVAEGKPTGGEGVMSSALGTTKRKDGTMQVTYHGRPLYTFSEDHAAGEANGNEFEGIWFVLNEAGSPVKGHATAAAGEGESEESGAAAGGYGY